MRVNPAKPHGAYAGTQWPIVGPRLSLFKNLKRGTIQFRVRILAACRRRQYLIVERHRGLDDNCNPCGSFSMTDIRLDAADDCGQRFVSRLVPCAGESFKLCAVTNAGACAMPFKIGHSIDAEVSAPIGAAQSEKLSFNFRPSDSSPSV